MSPSSQLLLTGDARVHQLVLVADVVEAEHVAELVLEDELGLLGVPDVAVEGDLADDEATCCR